METLQKKSHDSILGSEIRTYLMEICASCVFHHQTLRNLKIKTKESKNK